MNEAELPSEFRALLRPPVVAWPTILLFLACLSGLVGVAVLGLSEQIPLAPFDFARWIHMQHHRFTNDADRDPDHFGHKMDLFTPLRWLNFYYYYTKFFLEQAGDIRSKYSGRVLAQVLLILGLLVAAAYTGFFLEALMRWIVPTRISSFLFVAMFVHLPHAPFTHTAQQDEYRASNIRADCAALNPACRGP